MSEADSPNDQSGSHAPTESIALTAASDSGSLELSSTDNGEGWQILDFPGAMSVDAIPLSAAESVEPNGAVNGLNTPFSQGVIHYSNAEIAQTTMSFSDVAKTPDDATVQQPLQDENAARRDRAQVERDLVQQQVERQLESACMQTPTEAAVAGAEQPSTLQFAHERLSQLLQELERSRQTAQRQQILVETLTEQLESSQERIAQLERDCALTQQRHNNQVQQVLQAENACRDLRLRLHRQQQQTLQFKAALEKCLEMPSAYGQPMMPDMAIDDSMTATPEALAALLKPKNQPVKPWSLPQRAAHELEGDLAALPQPLFKLLNGLSTQGDTATKHPASDILAAELHSQFDRDAQSDATSLDPSALLDSDDPQFVTQLMQLIFPDGTEQHTYTTADALQGEPVLDVSPFLETDQANSAAAVAGSENELVSPEQSIDRPTMHPGASKAIDQQDTAVSSDVSAIDNDPAAPQADACTSNPLGDNRSALIELPGSDRARATGDVKTDASEADELPVASEANPDSTQSLAHDPLMMSMEQRFGQATPHSVGIPPIFTASTAARSSLERATEADRVAEPKNATAGTTKPIAAWTWSDRLAANRTPRAVEPEKTTPEKVAQKPAKAFAPGTVGHQTAVNPPSSNQAGSSSSTESRPMPFSTAVLSPIVYPLRSTKKIASLAAVDLPTFPKR